MDLERLSNDILAGAQMVGHRKAIGAYFGMDNEGRLCACAVGCLFLAAGLASIEQAKEYVREVRRPNGEPLPPSHWVYTACLEVDKRYGFDSEHYREAIVEISDNSTLGEPTDPSLALVAERVKGLE